MTNLVSFAKKTKKFEYVNEKFVVEPDVFEKAFQEWLDKYPNLPMYRKELSDFQEAQKARRAAQKAPAQNP